MELYNDFGSEAWSAVIYGPAGIGKTTFAARAPGAMIINLENGLKGVDLKASGAVATGYIDTYQGFLDALEYFGSSDYKTVVVDSLTRLETLIERHVCQQETARTKKDHNSLADFGFGRGLQALAAEFGVIIEYIETLKSAGKNVILLAHTKIATIQDPENEPYDQFDLSLDKRVVERIKGASDYVWYMHQEKSVKTADKAKAGKATMYNRILLQTKQTGGVSAKTRGVMEMYIEVKNDKSAKDIWNGL